jgi:hypothetical protein
MKFTELAQFQDKQLEAWYTLLDPKCKYLLYGGAAGGGKSYFLRWTAIGLAMYYASKGIERVPIGLFSEDYPTLRDRQVTKIMREFPTWLGTLKETQRDGLAFYLAPEYGSGVIMLRNLDDPSKYASVEFAAILVEELTKNDEETFEDLRTRLRFPGVDERKFIGATNPGQVGHGWVKRKWVKVDPSYTDLEQDRFFFVPAKYSDNKYNPEDYGIQLSAITDPQKRRALLDGSWDVFAGQYFDEWNPTLHVINPFIPDTNAVIVGGMDWGRAKPFANEVSTVEKVFYNERSFFRVKTFCETYGTEKNPAEWDKQIKEDLKTFNLTLSDIVWDRADPSIFNKQNDNSKSIRDQFVDADDRWRVLRPANNDRIQGWSIVHNWLSLAPDGLPYWQIASNCSNLIRTLPDLVHDENHVEDVDSEGEDHAPDAIRYMLKHLKWIDAKLGPVKEDQAGRTPKTQFFARLDDEGQQIAINVDRFKR